MRDVVFAPGDASTAYALTQSALWRSTDRGDSWTRVGYMNPLFNYAPAPSTVGIDAVDPQTVYIGNMRSRDGGQSWAEMDGIAMAVDPVRAGRLYSVTADYNPDDRLLQVSADWGHTWRTLDTRSMGDSWSGRLTIHPANTDILYYSQRRLYRSTDGGRTWAQTNGSWQAIQPDPADELGVFGLRDNELHYSSDAGESWRVLRSLGGLEWQIKAYAKGILVWGDVGELLRSGDSGVEEVALPPMLDVPPGDRTMTPFIDPRDPRRMFLSLAEGPRTVFMKTDDGGRSWRQITFPAIDSPAGALAFDAAGSLYIGSAGVPVPMGVHTQAFTRAAMAIEAGNGRALTCMCTAMPCSALCWSIDATGFGLGWQVISRTWQLGFGPTGRHTAECGRRAFLVHG